MSEYARELSFFDKLLDAIDNGLKTISSSERVAQRARPGTNVSYDNDELSSSDAKLSASLLRVDHAGEVCAQALYQGQALFAHSESVKQAMQKAAKEENDHLAWCESRLDELGAKTSYLNPLWYVGSFAIGSVASLVGDKWSLGFVVETERQVEQHLQSHLDKLPKNDYQSREVLLQMQKDEVEHATAATYAGAKELPSFIKKAMKCTAKLMTSTSFFI